MTDKGEATQDTVGPVSDHGITTCPACGQPMWKSFDPDPDPRYPRVCGPCHSRGRDEMLAFLRGITPEQVRAERERTDG